MAQIANPRKVFNFTISVAGLNPFLAQEVDIPDSEIDSVEHGDTNYLVKTAGMVKFTELTVKKISTADAPDNWVWEWQEQCQSAIVGGGDIPQNYKKTIVVTQYAVDGVSVLNEWTIFGCWPRKINNSTFSRKASENTMENIGFSVDISKHQ